MTAWVKLPEFRGDSSFGTWLYGISRNLCFRAMRKRGENLLAADGVVEEADPRASALSTLRRREREDLLRRASLVLQPLEQEAVHLRYVEHLPQDRITEVLGLESASGARGLLQRCRRKLGREMNRLLGELGHGTSFIRSSVT
jgi:RNA polymerase sigma-70 factor (ECF subfamily)